MMKAIPVASQTARRDACRQVGNEEHVGTSKHDVEVRYRDIAALGDPLAESQRTPPRTAGETVAPISSQPRIRLLDLVRLIYSGFLFIEPIQRKSAPYWLQFCAVYACFLILYFALLRSKTKLTSLRLLVLIGILGLVYFPSNGGALVLFIFVLSFAPQVVETLKACAFIFGAVCLAMAVEGTSFHLNPWLWAFGSVFAVAIGAGNLIIEQQRRSNRKLHLAHEDIERLAKIAERDRIARDLQMFWGILYPS